MRLRTTRLVLALTGLPAIVSAQQPAHHADKAPDRIELAAPEVVVPMKLVKGRPVVEATVDGKGPFPFVLDTGAGGTVFGGDLAKELELPELRRVRIGDPIKPGGISAVQVSVGRIVLGGATLVGTVATTMSHMPMEQHLGARGILGMPLFADLLLTLDYARGEIRIRRGELPPADGKEVVSYRTSPGGTVRLPIEVGTFQIDADVDSGSPAGVSLPNDYMEKLPLEGAPVEVGRARTVSSEFVVHAATLKGAVRIAGHSLETPSLRFNALPVANLGNEVLSRFTITIDQKNRRIRFVEAAPEAAGEKS